MYKRQENIFCRSGLRNTWNTCSQTISETVLKYFKRKNHFKVNVRLRPSNWHINKNIQKIKSILYQDSCWINRSPFAADLKSTVMNTLHSWSQDYCCEHLAQLISRLLLRTPFLTDLKLVLESVANNLHDWSWPVLKFVPNSLYDWRWPILESWVWFWEAVLKPVLWTKLTTCCSKCLMFLRTVSRLFSGLFWILHVMLANQRTLETCS